MSVFKVSRQSPPLYVLATELAVVVTRCRNPHFKHVDWVVEVSNPAFTSNVEVSVLTLFKEYVPVLNLNCHLDTNSRKILLDRFSNCNVICVLVQEIFNRKIKK